MNAPLDNELTLPTSAAVKQANKVGGGIPLLGHTLEFVRNTVGLLERAYTECGEVAKLKLANKNLFLFTGPAAHEALFRMPDEVLSQTVPYKMMVPVFGKGVAYDCEPARMNEQLHMLYPALRNERMRTYGELIASETLQAIESWSEQGQIDIVEFLQTLTNFTSSRCLLGPEFRNELSEEFAQVYNDLERGIVAWGYINPYLPIPAFRRRDRARARLGEMVSEIVQRRRRTGFVGDDFMQTLMEAQYSDGSKLSDHEITGMLVSAMFAGHHTSAVTAAWSLLELVRHPHYLQQIRAEIDQAYADGLDVTFESLRALERTDAAVKEALRLHPPLFILLRAALANCEVYGYQIKKGEWVAVSPLVAHKLDSVFASATSFNLERYEKPREEDKKPFAYISFGAGRHKCMGNAFALLQIKTIAAILLHKFEFELAGDPIATDFRGLVLGPKHPCRLKYRRRDHAHASLNAPNAKNTNIEGSNLNGSDQLGYCVQVDWDLCKGHANCMSEVPEIFRVDDKGHLQLLQQHPAQELRARLEQAVAHCPTGALSLAK